MEKKAAASVIKCLLYHNQQLFWLKFSAISDTVKAAEEILTQSCIIFCWIPGLPYPLPGFRQALPWQHCEPFSLQAAEQMPDL